MQPSSVADALSAVVQDFDIEIVSTPRGLREAQRLRHQVYCVERAYKVARDAHGDDALEQDAFDGRAMHAVARRRSDGEVIGTVRIVPGSPFAGGELPCGMVPGVELPRFLHGVRTVEISRFAISRDKRAAGSPALLRMALVRAAVEMTRKVGATHWCALMETALLRMLRGTGIHFVLSGDPVEHHGMRQPCWTDLDQMLDRMRRDAPDAWRFVTEPVLFREDA